MRFIDLFCGIGGFRYGLEKSGEFKCVFSSEIEKHAREIYKRNFGEYPTGDITKTRAEDIPEHDLLTAGFPCQSFSIAGKRKGFEDTRGTLFFEIARIVSIKRPTLLLLENVKGLLSHDNGRTFGTILSTLSDLGYVCEWQVLNSKDFGVSQNRERVFIIGHLGGKCRQTIFPIGESSKPNNEVRKEIDTGHQGNSVYDSEGLATTINSGGGGQGGKTGLYQIRGGTQKNAGIMNNQSTALTEAMGKGGGHIPIINMIRRLTPIECERLQGFPDNWTQGISDSQRYKCLGNAVTTNVIYAIGKRIIEVYN